MSGRVVHFELPVDDVERAKAFYGTAFDWQLSTMPEMHYTMVVTTPSGEDGMPKDPGAINGGLSERAYTPAPNPVITIDVTSIEDALKEIEAAGGSTVTAKMQVGDMGFAAYFKDTEGNIVGLWQNA